jgi:CheY-like chemotaxis protein
LDISVDGLLDAFWLALQPGFRLEVLPPKKETAGPEPTVPSGSPDASAGPVEAKPVLPPSPGPPEDPAPRKVDDRQRPPVNTGVFARGALEGEKETRPASPLRVPAGTALGHKLPLTRSLRPLRTRFKNAQVQELDEDATVDATALAGGRLMPVLQPRLERWYELILVADSVPSMDVWYETMLEFEGVTRTAGVFRDVRHYRLLWKPVDGPDVSSPDRGAVLLNTAGVPFPATALAQTNVRRLIFIATNGSALHWTDGRMAALLTVWSKQCSVAIVHMLPERLWHQVRMGEPELLMTTLTPGAPAASLDAAASWWGDDIDDSDGNLRTRIPGALPILPLDPEWIRKWARMQMGGGQRVPGTIVGIRADKTPRPFSERTPEDWKKAVDAFTRNCTPEARNLSVYLSQGSFTLPVARLVQTAKLGPAASQTQLAEIMLSGLVQRTTPADATIPRDWVEYGFHPEAAKLLVRGLRESDAKDIAEALEEHIERYWGKPIDFRALVYDVEGLSAIPGWAQPFAQLGRSLLDMLPAKSARELVEQFRRLQPPRVVGLAAHEAIMAGQGALGSSDIDLLSTMEKSGLIRRNDAGEWRFLEGIQPLLAEIASSKPLLGVEILWVDDHPENNTHESSKLELQGAAIETSSTTDGALVYLRKRHFDIVITDMRRGDDSQAGVTLMDRMRALDSKVPVIVYSARFSAVSREAVFRAGAYACTNNPDELFNSVRNAALRMRPGRIPGDYARAIVRVEAGNASALGVFVTNDGHVVTVSNWFPEQLKEITVTVGEGIKLRAEILATTPELGILKVDWHPALALPLSADAEFEDAFGPLKVVGFGGSGSWDVRDAQFVGLVDISRSGQTYLQFVVKPDLREPFGGGPVVNGEGEIVGVLYSREGTLVNCVPAVVAVRLLTETLQRKDDKQQAPDTTGRESLLKWMAELDLPQRRPILVVDGPAGSARAATIAILSSVAAQSGKFDVVSIDLSAAVYRDVGVEGVMREIARRAELDAKSLPHRPRLDPDRYVRYAMDWLVGNIGLRPKPIVLAFDNVDSSRISPNVRRFVDRLMESSNRAPNLNLVFLGYRPVDIPPEARPYVLIELLADTGRPSAESAGRWSVLVVGTGSYNLPKPVELAARGVGSVVGESGCRLITGGWQGVDHVAASAFIESRKPKDSPSEEALVQVVEGSQQPDFKGGSIVRAPHNQGISESLKRADLVILIGGAGATWQAFRGALAANKLVVPLMTTGTDAQQAAILLEILGQHVPIDLIRADFSGSSSVSRLLLQDVLQTVDIGAATKAVDNSDLLWMVNTVLPLADEYLRKAVDFDEDAERILKEFESHELAPRKRTRLIVALVENRDPAWRIAGYLAIEARPSTQYAELLMASLEKEVKQGLERIETRPLWRWLSAVRTLPREYPKGFPHDFTVRLEELAQTLQKRPDVDPGGECKRLLGDILQIAKPRQTSILSRKKKKEKKKK